MVYLGEYTEVGWQNEPSRATPINAHNLGVMEDGIKRLFYYLLAGGGTGGGSAADGREVELRNNGEYIQWKYSGDEEWINLVSLSDLKGEKGDDYVLTEEDILKIAEKVKIDAPDSASDISFENEGTNIESTDVQGAISELSGQIADMGKPTDEQVENAVKDYLEENPIEGGTVTNVTDKPYHLQKIGVLYENPEGYDYIAWCPSNLKYDENLGKYVSLVYGSTQHINGSTALFVAYINPDTFEATEPVQCFTDNGATPLKGSTAFWIEDGIYKMLYEYTDKKTYIFTSTDYGVNWTKGEAVSGFSGSPWGITKLSNGRLICADDQTKKGIYYSDNGGVNWTNVIPTTCGGGYEAEACILELQEGKLIAIARYSMSGIGYNDSGASESAVVSFSEDYGTTWTPWKKSETITNMNASSCTGHVHNGMVDIFACSRWYWHGSNKNDDFVNTGKTGAITHYTATVENALKDNFTNMGIVAYANAVGDGSSQDFHSPCMAVNGDDMLLMWFDRIYPYTAEVTSHYFARGSKGDLDTAPRDDLSSAVFPYSSAKVDKLLQQQYTKLMTKINEIIINGGGTPDTGDDPENPNSYVFDGCIMNLNYLDTTKYDVENKTLTDSINGLVGTFYTDKWAGTVVDTLPVVRKNSIDVSIIKILGLDAFRSLFTDAYTIEFSVNVEDVDLSNAIYDSVTERWLAYLGEDPNRAYLILPNELTRRYISTEGTSGSEAISNRFKNIMDVDKVGFHHGAYVYSADGKLTTYKQGKAFVTVEAPSDFSAWDFDFMIKNIIINGPIKTVRIYKRALTEDEVLQNYNYELQGIV